MIMRTLKAFFEGILSDIDDTIATADKYVDILKQAEKDWYKLLYRTTAKKYWGDRWCVSIKSPELAAFFGTGHSGYEKYKEWIDTVLIEFPVNDIFHNNRSMSIILKSNKSNVVTQATILYSVENGAINHSSVRIGEACKCILDEIKRSEQFNNLSKAKQLFDSKAINTK